MFTFSYFRAFFTVICFRYSVSLECYNCSNITNVNTCGTITTCQSGQSCYLDFSNTAEYTLGCIENQKCGALPHVSASLVGRNLNGHEQNIVNDRRDLAKRETGHCFECCSFEICNRVLCAHLKPTICIDDPKVDCAWLNSKFNICQIVHEAKTVCPKFCGLCSLVDGNWGDWSPWGYCDVTCENGTQTRVRHCNNPSPVNGGLNCSGSDLEQKPCALQTCPVDGNWDSWSFWSSCDVTCLNGTQTRTRSCNNPAPAYNGSNCSGNSLEYKQCMKDVCPVHGGWTQWLPWEACSVTCDIGIQRRHRNCSNPIPQNAGHYCFGDPMDVEMCMPGSCAATPTVAFQAHELVSTSLRSSGTFVFSKATLNAGNAYNTVTGIFTAPVAGTYFFSTQICMLSSSNNYVVFHITHNGNYITSTYAAGNTVVTCNTADASAVLHVNDTVRVVHSRGEGNSLQSSEIWNMFSGSLQHL